MNQKVAALKEALLDELIRQIREGTAKVTGDQAIQVPVDAQVMSVALAAIKAFSPAEDPKVAEKAREAAAAVDDYFARVRQKAREGQAALGLVAPSAH